MKKLSHCAAIAACAFCLTVSIYPPQAHADSVTLTLENVGPGNLAGGYYAYPYNFSIDGSAAYTPMMCLSFNNDIYLGESWTADIYSIPAADALAGNDSYALAAWLLNDEAVNPSNVALDQLAAWGLFADNVPDASNAQLAAAEAGVATEPASFYDRFQILVPEPGTQSEGGLPQTFVEDPPPAVPEPGSLLLLGSGLLVLAGFSYCGAHGAARPQA